MTGLAILAVTAIGLVLMYVFRRPERTYLTETLYLTRSGQLRVDVQRLFKTEEFRRQLEAVQRLKEQLGL